MSFGKKCFWGCLFRKMFFWGLLFGKTVFWAAFWKQFFRWAKSPRKRPSQSIGHQRIQPTKKLSQKAKPSPSKNRFKFQNNKDRALRRSPRLWGCCLEIWIDFLKDFDWLFGWAFLLAGFFDGLCLGIVFSMDFWSMEELFSKSGPKIIFPNNGHSKNLFLQNPVQ